ncbi:MAG: bifunctional serine/threonine-protein kinase/formylglycine-generating enzyme family protein [Planctomycetales bacterium]|nr:bifunctional serine/threonine-protein kinase/formylglycine-generating enzyme family protein [Planctomycetales bacterium]
MRIGPYEILGELGAGGMARVYRARDTDLRRDVALKVLEPGSPPEYRVRFVREGRTGARLRHPGIVAVHAAGEADGHAYIVQELVEGETLAEALGREPLPPSRAARLVEKVARALAYAHGEGVIHRDVKPGNILLDADAEPHLADFGLARTVEASAALSQSGVAIGTPNYMAPEQAEGRVGVVDARTDVWACGVVLYECLAAAPPFEGGPQGVMEAIVWKDPVPLRKRAPGVPPGLEAIVGRCLEKDPARRYPGAGALAEDLARFLAGRPVEARFASRLERLRRQVRRNPVPYAAGSLAGLLLLALGAVIGLGALRDRELALEAERIARAAEEAGDHATAARMWTRLADLRGPTSARGAEAVRLAGEAEEASRRAARRAVARDEIEAGDQARGRWERARAALARLRSPAPGSAPVGADDGSAVAPAGSEGPEGPAGPAGPAGEDPERLSAEREAAFAQAWGFYLAARGAVSDASGAPHRPGEPEWEQATSRLADLAWERLREAEESGLRTDARRFEAELRAYGAERYARQLEGSGTLTLDTVPTGARVEFLRYEDPPGGPGPGERGRLVARPFRPGTGDPWPGAPVATPLVRLPLPMGSYLLLLCKPGFRDVRTPVLIERNEDEATPEPIRLLSEAEIGEGYVYVPGGETILGGDPKAYLAWPRRKARIGPFCIAEREVSVGEYREFLQALLAGEGRAEGEVLALAPRRPGGGPRGWSVRDGEVATSWKADRPVSGVSWEDATAYCDWRTRVEGRAVSLPSEEEWERAARGGDGRSFPWGEGFRWEWTAGGRTHEPGQNMDPGPVGGTPEDVSPFGVLDLAGNVIEWCRDSWPPDLRAIRGAGAGLVNVQDFRVASRAARGARDAFDNLGFRVRAEPRSR